MLKAKATNGQSRNTKGQFVSNKVGLQASADRQFIELVSNAMTSRSDLARSILDPRRDINVECGHPETGKIIAADYRALYEREGIATR